jgi:hypothetical protein
MKQNEANINNLNQFIGRLPASARPEHRNLVQEAFGIVGALDEKARAIRADGRFTSAGHMEQIQAVARDGILDHLKQVKGRTQALTDDLDRLRAAVALRAPAKDDITGELRRAEIRAHMRSLPTAERVRIALSEDETVSMAVTSAPAFLSGLTDDLYGRVRTSALERQHGPLLAEIEQQEAALQVVNTAVNVAVQQVRSVADLKTDEI